jgi:hypothetical protein
MSRLFIDVQRAAVHSGGAAHPSLRVRDLVATGQVTSHTVSSPVVASHASVRESSSTVAAISSAPHSCAHCIATPVGVVHNRAWS